MAYLKLEYPAAEVPNIGSGSPVEVQGSFIVCACEGKRVQVWQAATLVGDDE